MNDKEMTSKSLRRKLMTALLALLIAFAALSSATFAWYIYNTNAHTTNVHMAAGSSTTIKISDAYDGVYSTSTSLQEFQGSLNPVSTNWPVSTDEHKGGFQKVYGFTDNSETKSNLVANLFGEAESKDYYKTSLYLKSDGDNMRVYLSGIGYEDDDKNNPISTAIRVAFVVHKAGRMDIDGEHWTEQPVENEYIFAINTANNPEAEYNTAKGEDGQVLDSSKINTSEVYDITALTGDDVPLVSFTPYTTDNFCDYDSNTGAVTVRENSIQIATLNSDGEDGDGDAVQVDIYIWLEGCDKDCTNNLCGKTLKSLSLSFCGTNQ